MKQICSWYSILSSLNTKNTLNVIRQTPSTMHFKCCLLWIKHYNPPFKGSLCTLQKIIDFLCWSHNNISALPADHGAGPQLSLKEHYSQGQNISVLHSPPSKLRFFFFNSLSQMGDLQKSWTSLKIHERKKNLVWDIKKSYHFLMSQQTKSSLSWDFYDILLCYASVIISSGTAISFSMKCSKRKYAKITKE